MKLHALRLHGFKSFADRTEIVFHDGITAIVGPNGCGKSNISDAIRWVLGEQRPTAIRGAKMEEAIFQGTVNRRPVNRGSVAMEVTNEDGALPVPFKEVEIARTMYRDGGSDYLLNRSACRLRDIQDLCRDTGLGANAYAVIENRMIDAILSDRAEERRGLFEEAAGIGKYKDRRRAATRRLERAELDLQRLEDLIAEVQSKVRSLARQKGKAERFRELRTRRLDVEVAVVRGQLTALEERLAEVRKELSGGVVRDEGLRAGIAAAEGRLEALRVDQVTVERARREAGARVDEVRGALVRWERELAVAEERAAFSDRRLIQIETERVEASARAERAARSEEELGERRAAIGIELERLVEAIAVQVERGRTVRDALTQARGALAEVENREREVALRMARLHGDAAAAETRGTELERRIEHLDHELAEARDTLSEVASQGDLFTDRVAGLERATERATQALEEALAAVGLSREELQAARAEELAAQDRHGSLAARSEALSGLERDQEGADGAVPAVLARNLDGVAGTLAEALRVPAELARTVDAVLGIHLRALVVRDSRVATELARWFAEEWKGGGGLILLPLDRVPEVPGTGGLLERLTVQGPGAPWARALLDGVELAGSAGGRKSAVSGARGDRVSPDGAWFERGGIFRIGNPLGATGLLEKKEGLKKLAKDVRNAAKALEAARGARAEREGRLAALEGALEMAREKLRGAEDAFRIARSQEEARSERNDRAARIVEELDEQLSLTKRARERATEQVREAIGEREGLLEEENGLRTKRGEARERLDAAQDRWEEMRVEESRLTVDRARVEGEISRLDERLEHFAADKQGAIARREALDTEEAELQAERARVAALREEGKTEMERLFALRSEADREFEEKDTALTDLHAAISEAEAKARQTRAAEREGSERRHALELEDQDLQGRTARLHDRLEAEWGRPFSRLVEEAREIEGDEEELRLELRDIVEALERLGPVNMLAVEEHEEESERLTFLTEQRDDLVQARNDLRAAIREINQTATRLFSDTFEAIRGNFRETFLRLFQGGECDLWLSNPDDPLESDVEIHAAPRGKKTQRIELLSGGERALTALSLLFGIYLVKPSPFCVLDEVDAPLDESNIGRFIRLLQEFKAKTQFVVITHNPRTIEAADWIYGVTMEEPGISTIVGVRLDEALEVAGA
ncbi:MAG: chromosome segregation protein SMC [Gemmatimonadota bacterium]